MALIDIGNVWAADPTTTLFKTFVGGCLVAASQVMNEDPGTANHAKRIAWAKNILSDDISAVTSRIQRMFRYSLATNATFQGNPTGMSDGDIQFIVNSVIDIFSQF